MKKILISLVTIIVLVMMMLPVTSQPVTADPVYNIDITSDPGTGDLDYIYNSPGNYNIQFDGVPCVDNDDDGYDAPPCGDDCDDTDPNINPGATEICNGLDDDCDGEVDEGDICGECEECYEPVTQTIVSDDSDTTTYVIAGNVLPVPTYPYVAVLAWEPDPYPTTYLPEPPEAIDSTWDTGLDYDFSISGADWIWESHRPVNPDDGDVVTFENTVTIPAGATNIVGTIHITCDNGYEVWLDSTFVGSAQVYDGTVDWQVSDLTQSYVDTTNWQSVENWSLTGLLHTGDNIFTFECANEYMGPLDSEAVGTIDTNPAGLIFEIEISYCAPIECDDGDPCTTDECVEGECVFTPIVCDDEDPCTTDECVDGQCVFTPIVCDDGDLCTTDECVDGVCVYTPVVCPDSGYEEDGGPYTECVDSQVCTYQDWIWVDYPCDIATGECVRLPDENKTDKRLIGCSDCGDCEECVGGECVPVECDPCYECESQTIVSDASDTTTYVTAGNVLPAPTYPYVAVLAWEYNNDIDPSVWDTSLDYDFSSSGADWIWESYRPVNTEDGDVVTFQNTVTIPSGAINIVGTIHITCDNGYEVWLDGSTLVGSAQVYDGISGDWQVSDLTQPYVDTTNWQSVENWSLTGLLHTGDNIFTFECANEQLDGGTEANNPAGLIFEIEISYCVPIECDPCYECVDGVCTPICTECEECVEGVCEPIINADAGPDQAIPTGGTTGIGGAPTASGGTPAYTYSWTPTTGLDDATLANPTASPTSTTTYTVVVTDSDECSNSDSMTVTVTTPPPPPSLLGGGGGYNPDKCYLIVDMLGERTMVEIDCCLNTTLEECEAYDAEEIHLLELVLDTLVRCGDCGGCFCYPKIIVMSLSDETPAPPEGMTFVGPVYDFTGYKDLRRELACQLVTYFDPVASVLLNYDPALLPPGATDPVIAFYNHDLGQWVILPPDTGRVAEVGVVSGLAAYFASPFAVLVNVPPPPTIPEPPALAPAHFVASGLSILPAEIKVGESVTISLNVANDGEETGTYIVELKINGQTIDSQVVTLDGGQSEPVSFTITETEAGQYEVTVSGLSGSFGVVKTSIWWIYLIIAAIVIILGGLGWRYRKKLGIKSS